MGLVVVNIDPFDLKVGALVPKALRVDPMLVGDDLPELGTDLEKGKSKVTMGPGRTLGVKSYLVTALTGLDVDDLTHDVVLN